MKVLIIFFVFSFLSITKVAGQNYVPFPVDSTEWHGWYHDQPPGWSLQSGDLNYYAYNDTLLNGKTYRVVTDSTGTPIFGYREFNKRIYTRSFQYYELFYCDTDSTERVVYDFNLNVGDTFMLETCWHDTMKIIVLKIDSTQDNAGLYRKRFFLSRPNAFIGGNCGDTIQWVEGVGASYSSFFYYLDQTSLCYGSNYVCDMYVDNIRVYTFLINGFTCNQLRSIILENKKNERDELISIYPNPTDRYLIIDAGKLYGNYSCSIGDLFGKELFQEYSKNEKIIMDLQSLDTGTYFIVVRFLSGKIISRKLLKM
jgi:hypothetical protein